MNIAELSVVFGAKMEQFDRAMSSFERKLETAGRKAKQTGDMLSKNLTAPIVAIAGSMAFAIKKTADYADEIDKMSIRTELSREKLQEFDFVAGQTGVTLGSLESAVDSLRRRLPQIDAGTGRASDNFARLGISVRDANGEMRPMNDIFDEAILALSQVENVTERNAMAMDIFGRSASQITPILDLGIDKLQEMRQESHDLGLVMGDETVKELVEFNDEMDKLRRQGGAVAREFAMTLLPLLRNELIPFLQNTAIPAVRSIAERFQELDDSGKRNIIMFAGLVAAVGPALSIMGRLLIVLPQVRRAFKFLNRTMLANPYLAVGAAVLALAVNLRNVAEAAKDTNYQLNRLDIQGGDSLDDLKRQYFEIAEEINKARKRLEELSELDPMFKASGTFRREIIEIRGMESALQDLGRRIGEATVNQREQDKATDDFVETVSATNQELKELERSYDDLLLRFNAGIDVLEQLEDAIEKLKDEHAVYGAKIRQVKQDIIDANEEEIDALIKLKKQYEDEQQTIADTIQLYRMLIADRRTAAAEQERQERNSDAVRNRQEESEWFDRIRNAVVGVYQEVNVLEEDTENMTQAWMMFGDIAATALNQALFQARRLEDVLANILRQLASQTLTGLIMGGIGAATGIGFLPGFLGAFGLSGQRASGGFARAGSTMLVGERGPEIVQVGANSTVTPLAQAMQGSTAPQRIDIHIHGTLGARGRDLVYTIDEYRRLQG